MIHVIDCETSGLKHSHGHRAFAVGYTDEKEQPQAKYMATDDFSEIASLTEDPDREWVGHNIGFDLPFLNDFLLYPVGKLHDTMIAAHVFNNLEDALDLASLAKKYCNIDNTEDVALDQWFVDNGYNKDNRNYADVPVEIMTPYLKADLVRTLALFKFYKSKGVIEDAAYIAEMNIVPLVARIVARGMHVDVPLAKSEFNKAIGILADYETIALRDYKLENIASPAQLADALFTRGGLKCTTFTVKKNICLDETALQQYDHPLVEIVLKHRQLSKLTNTYLTAIIEKSHNNRLFCSLRQVGARTGRFSSADPNLQNIPRYDEQALINLRKCFTCPKDAKMLLVDLSQIELRILAHYSKEPEMLRVLSDRKGDLHKATSIAMFGEVNDELRTIAKTINFGTIYGAGGSALQQQINKALPARKITLEQAKDFKNKYFKGFPMVQQFTWDVQTRIAERGYVTGKSGRKYYCDKKSAYRGTNYLIQGEAAMLMKKMMYDTENYLAPHKTKLVNVIHDEMIFDLAKNEEILISHIMEIIEGQKEWRVPIYANAAISETSWAEKRKL